MIFGYISGMAEDGDAPDLCLVADKTSSYSKPVRIRSLIPTECGVHLLSNEEGFLLSMDPTDNAKVIAPIRPTRLHLTPNLPDRPGFSVTRIKVIEYGHDQYQVWYDRDKGWEEWTPNRKGF